MRLVSLSLEQFRSYQKLGLTFEPESDVQMLIGENGSGKTNILEAVSVLAFTKSFLAAEEEDLIRWGTEYYRVSCKAKVDDGTEKELEIVSQFAPRRQKGFFRNGVRVPLSRMVGELPVVIFLPQDLSLFSGAPAERRRYLDQILCQVSPEYFGAAMDYQKFLKQRNALLRSIREGNGSVADLGTWNDGLADRGSLITLLRLELMETFGVTLPAETRALGENWTDVKIVYERKGSSRDREGIRQELLHMLSANADRDVILQSTSVGPHRDDWHVIADGHPLESFASRGQQRVAVLSLLFLEASYIEVRRGEKPIILLDDIFSELDENHRSRVLDAFRGHQVLMTATDVPEGKMEGAVWEVGGGKVRESVRV